MKIIQRWCFINRSGKMVVEPKFDVVYKFSDGLARVEIGDKLGYIDRTGTYIWSPTK